MPGLPDMVTTMPKPAKPTWGPRVSKHVAKKHVTKKHAAKKHVAKKHVAMCRFRGRAASSKRARFTGVSR